MAPIDQNDASKMATVVPLVTMVTMAIKMNGATVTIGATVVNGYNTA